MKKLCDLLSGETAKISTIKGNTRFLSRIASIGLTPGCYIKVLRNDHKQPLLLYGRDSMIAVNRVESAYILVEG